MPQDGGLCLQEKGRADGIRPYAGFRCQVVGAHIMRPLFIASQTTWHKPGGPGRSAELPFGVLSSVLSRDGKNQRIAGGWLRGAPALQSPTPGPPLRGTLPGQSFLASGAGGAADCPRFPAAAADREISGELSGWTMEARLVPAAVGAGPDTAGGWYPPLRNGPQLKT